jgi:hypothetical protein
MEQPEQTSEIKLSVILRVVGGELFINRCLNQLIKQIQDQSVELIVPYDITVDGFDRLKQTFPQVIFLNIRSGSLPNRPGESHALFDLRTAAGLRSARGEILALIEDYGVPDSDWVEQVLKAHQLPYAAIGGAVEHSGEGRLNWAVYFLDFSRYTLPLKEGLSNYLTDVNISYKRSALESIRKVWESSYNEVTVNWALSRSKECLWLRPQMVVRQNRGKLHLRQVATERYDWGRLFAQKRAREIPSTKRILYGLLCPFLAVLLISRICRKVFSDKRYRKEFFDSFLYLVLFAVIWSFGEFTGYLWIGKFVRDKHS